MRRWLERLAVLGMVAGSVGLFIYLTYLLVITPWALATFLLVLVAGMFGWALGVAVLRSGDQLQATYWKAKAEEYEEIAELMRLRNAELEEQIKATFEAGLYHGQQLAYDQKENGL